MAEVMKAEEIYRWLYNTIENHFEDSSILPEVVEFCHIHDTDPEFEEGVARLTHNYRAELMSILLCNTYNIFKPWYLRMLERMATEDGSYSFRAQDLLNYYKDGFDWVRNTGREKVNEDYSYEKFLEEQCREHFEYLIEHGAIDKYTLDIDNKYKKLLRK